MGEAMTSNALRLLSTVGTLVTVLSCGGTWPPTVPQGGEPK